MTAALDDRRASRRPATPGALARGAILALLVPLAACKTLRETFPKREDVFKPIPVSLGEERVVGRDTSYVLSGRGYQVITRDRDLLPDAKTALDRTSSAYRRYFAADPPVVGVLLHTPPRKGQRPDSLVMPGAHVVTMTGWRESDDDTRSGALPPEARSGFVALPLARAWLAALADSLAGPLPDSLRAPASKPATPGPATTPTPTPTPGPTASRPAPAGPAAGPASDDPRVPDWLERAVPPLVAGSMGTDLISLQLAQHPDKLMPLRSVVTAPRPAAPADASQDGPANRNGRAMPRGGYPAQGRGVRGAPALSGAALFDAQAVSFADFLAQREGRPFVGQVATALIRGRSFDQAIAGATTVPRDVDTLDRAWRAWLDTQRADFESRGPGR